jgi:RNA polymerase sigma factor (sigma-70 family)
LIFIWQIPPFSRNDRIFVLRGYKMGWRATPFYTPSSHRHNVIPSEARNLYALSHFFFVFVQFVIHTFDFEDFLAYLEKDDLTNAGAQDFRMDMYQNLIGDEVTIAINSLPVDFKTVILLCDIEGFTYEEISKITDIPIGTVRSRLHRGRRMLREKLKKYATKLGYKDTKEKAGEANNPQQS